MRIIARGYTHWDPIIAPDPVTIVTVRSMAEYDSLQEARRDLWWSAQPLPDPDGIPRWLGYAIVAVGLLILMGLAGWIEGLS